MNTGLASLLLLILGLAMDFQAVSPPIQRGKTVKLEITRIEPAPPADPFRQISVGYSISNSSSNRIVIPDLNRLELEICNEAGTWKHKRALSLPMSFSEIADLASAKVPPPNALPVEIQPQGSYRGSFPVLDAWPPLPEGSVLATLRLPAADGSLIESQPYRFQVLSVHAASKQHMDYGQAPFAEQRFAQELIVVEQAKGIRMLLLASVYPGFLSVVADAPISHPAHLGLLHSWPQEQVRWLIAEFGEKAVILYRAEKQGPRPTDRLTLFDSLPLAANTQPIGVIRVGLDEKKIGIEDYLLVLLKAENAGKWVVGEYWRRTNPTTWSRAEVFRSVAGETPMKLQATSAGFAVHTAKGISICEIPIASKLAEYRRLASADPAPIRRK
jgi:hypothetical protein